MKDLYSFDMDEAGLEASYRRMKQAYTNVYKRCGLDAVVVEADSGAIGGKDSHEFMVVAETGEDEIIYCDSCNYAANAEKATCAKPRLPEEAQLPTEEVATPGAKTIEEVASFLGVPRDHTLKAVFYSADGELVFVTVRGDLEVNEVKLKNILKCTELRLANDDEVRAAGLVAGSASAIGLTGVKIVADESITMGQNFIVGANKDGYHLKNANYPRDFDVDVLEDIALARAGHGCPGCGSELRSTRGVEVGHIFKLGTVFSERQGALYLDSGGQQKPMVMGCYGIGVGRLLAAAIEQNHDEKGIMWPVPIAPYHVYLCVLGADEPDVMSAAERVYAETGERGIEVLLDDRGESPGVKFNDADLLGMPARVVVSKRSLRSGGAEVKLRWQKDIELVPLDELPERLAKLLGL
jgi:prolyl-tRNA synthetase